MKFSNRSSVFFIILFAALVSCKENNSSPSPKLISQLGLKTGSVISCGPSNQEFGTVSFNITAHKDVQADFNTALELLHSFEYDEAEKVFAKIIDQDPQCAMAYWGVAMCSFHPLWEPPSIANLKKGSLASGIASSIAGKTKLETGFINAVAAYYKDWEHTDALVRSLHFEKAMQQVHETFPGEKEAAIFYALALDASADPTDKTYANQRKAGAMLESLYAKEPNHPGIIHYIIHTYDYPGLATLALPAARNYASIAPSSAHAQHMPSHIFTRLGLWDEAIQSNLQSVSSAQCYAKSSGIKGHWDEELHGLDYLVYAYLQKADNKSANEQLQYLNSIDSVYPANFKVAYAFAAIPARIALENKNWEAAAALKLHPGFAWNKFPWQESIIHFGRLLGMVHTNRIDAAKNELAMLSELNDELLKEKDIYKAKQVLVQLKSGEAWINFTLGNKEAGLNLMKTAAAIEDSTAKHPVTPGEVLPAGELYADMLMEMKDYSNAFQAYKLVLEKSPGRFNSLYGAGLAAKQLGMGEKAAEYFKQLPANSKSERTEIIAMQSTNSNSLVAKEKIQ
jgi:hypothetical protein